jgi:hypothetical protein
LTISHDNYNYFHNTYGNIVNFVFTVTPSGGSPATHTYSASLANGYLIPVSGSAPYHITTSANLAGSGGTLMSMPDIDIDHPCPDPGPDGVNPTACYYPYGRGNVFKVVFPDLNYLLYAAIHHLHPVAYYNLYGGSAYPGGAGPFPATTINGYEFDFLVPPGINAVNRPCFDLAICLVDSNGQIDPSTYHFAELCPCPDIPCAADFELDMDDYNTTDAALTFFPYFHGTVVSESFTVTGSGISPIYSGPSVSIIVPYGSYTVCHTLVSRNEDGDLDTCQMCKTVCYGTSENLEQHRDSGNPCNLDFSVSVTPHSSTMAAVTVLRNYFGTISSEYWTISNGSYSTTVTNPATILVPYGTYTICYTVISEGGQRCTVCKDVCFGGSGVNINGDGRLGALRMSQNARLGSTNLAISPNPSSTSAAVTFYTDADAAVQVQIVDALGRNVYERPETRLSKGTQRFDIETSSLSTGLYTLKLYINKTLITHKMSVVH